MPSATCRRWCVPASHTCSSRRFIRSWTARKAVELLERLGVLRELSGKRRGRAYAYQEYLRTLADEA